MCQAVFYILGMECDITRKKNPYYWEAYVLLESIRVFYIRYVHICMHIHTYVFILKSAIWKTREGEWNGGWGGLCYFWWLVIESLSKQRQLSPSLSAVSWQSSAQETYAALHSLSFIEKSYAGCECTGPLPSATTDCGKLTCLVNSSVCWYFSRPCFHALTLPFLFHFISIYHFYNHSPALFRLNFSIELLVLLFLSNN